MQQGDRVQPYLQGLVELFLARCPDKSTMEELKELLSNQDRWIEAHALFSRIRSKLLDVDDRIRLLARSKLLDVDNRTRLLASQYSFEEICAKTMFNLTDTNAPFDADWPFFVIPFALHLARDLGIADEEVIWIVGPRNEAQI
jgi:hypothetical protein